MAHYITILRNPPDWCLQTGRGGIVGFQSTGGEWSGAEKTSHINFLKLFAVLFTLQALETTITNSHIKLQVDNTAAVSYLQNMGGSHFFSCNLITKQIWEWCKLHNVWLCATHILGVENKSADSAS